MRDHHHYHYLFAKQRPTLGPILIAFPNCNERFSFGGMYGAGEEGVWMRCRSAVHNPPSTRSETNTKLL